MGNREQKRILCIVGAMNAGGAETFLMKVYRALDREKYQMDFYVATQEECYYETEILSMGGRVYHSVPKSAGAFKAFLALKNVVKAGRYRYVLRVSQHSLSALDLLAAKLGGARVLVYRSSNSATGGNTVNRVLHTLFQWLSMTVPTLKIAPSTEAAEFMFGKNCVEKGRAVLVKNAISVENFVFRQEKRDAIRRELGLEDQFVVGHVGRFSRQKNHMFLLDVFNEILKTTPDSVLLLVGKGELEEQIRQRAADLGIKDRVVLTGVRPDVAQLMMGMDVFVFPSFFEGMPNTVIEAQATGLPCVISDTITKEAGITGLVHYTSLQRAPKAWAQAALKYADGFVRQDMTRQFIDSGYEINTLTRQIETLFFGSDCPAGK